MRWKPRTVVAAIIERDNKFLVVEEVVDGLTVINQPSGHLEANETLIEAVRRETLEETGYSFEPTHLVGVIHLTNPDDPQRNFIRYCYTGKLLQKHANYSLDPDIITTHWMTYEQILSAEKTSWRSSLVMESLDKYLAGNRYPLDLISDINLGNVSTCNQIIHPHASSWAYQGG
ncbi:MAG: NUDIX hydrolase [Thiotrichaceae bacterium]|nr:NUDIX hydrolase [Thiotrichaceae bacterium]